MPRAALLSVDEKPVALISYDGKEGAIILSAGPNTFLIEPTTDVEKNSDLLLRMVRYIRALAPTLPPLQPKKVEGTEIPEVSEEDVKRATRFTATAAVKGGPKLQKATREDVLDLLASLPVPTPPSEPKDD